MAASSANKDCDAVLDALAVGDICHACVLLTERVRLDFQEATEVVISGRQREALKFLITEYKLDVDKYYCLHLALLTGQENIAKWLIDSGADVNKCWEVRDQIDRDIHWQKHVKLLRTYYSGWYAVSYHSPLYLSMNCSADMMRFLLVSGANTSLNRHITRYGETVLHIAVQTGNVEKIKLLIDHGADVEARTTVYETALMYACRNSTVSPDCVQVLLEKGANPNSRTVWSKLHKAPIHCAIENGDTQKLQLLIQHGAQLEARTSKGNTALTLACQESVPVDCVRVLLEHGAFPNARSEFCRNPLTLATATNYEEKISLLKQYGATEEERSDQEETALMSACQRNGDVERVRHLLENNYASPNGRNRRGKTALHYAVLAGDTHKLQVLVQYNSDVNAMDDNGVTPLEGLQRRLY